MSHFTAAELVPSDRFLFKCGDVQTLSDSLTRGVVVHRGRALEWREAEGSKGPWQTMDGWPAQGGQS